MKCASRKSNEIVVIRVEGRMNAETVPHFENECGGWINRGEKGIILDFSGLEYISSAGLRSIMSIGKRLKTEGGIIAFSGLTGMVREVFDISGLASIFVIHSSLEEALEDAAT